MKLLELIAALQAAHEKTGDVEVRAWSPTSDDGGEKIDCVTVANGRVFIDAETGAKTGGGL